jgi:hypothetical protein
MDRALTMGQATPDQLYGIFDTGVYLILHTPVSGPTYRHDALLFKRFRSVNFSG